MTNALLNPGLVWDGPTPRSTRFDDVYFSKVGGLDETGHVFLAGNGLPLAWSGKSGFVIGELGFGTGLNFLAVLDLWRKTRRPGARLHYVAVEGFPLSRSEVASCLAQFPQLDARALLDVYPEPQAGFHRLFPAADVTLMLLCGEVADVLGQLEAHVDAWFLDGFAPDRNPAMWSGQVFSELARLSRAGASLATYSAASDVRRRLEAAGFEITKTPGFGAKREMLTARFRDPPGKTYRAPWFAASTPRAPGHAAIIGGGVAGASMVRALQKRGWRTTIVERNTALATEGSGNPAAVLAPRLTAASSFDGRFYASAWRFALEELRGTDLINPGLLQLALGGDEHSRHGAILGTLPPSMLSQVSASAASDIAGCAVAHSALYFPQGGWFSPSAVCAGFATNTNCMLGVNVESLHHDGLWRVRDTTGATILTADIVVLANAIGATAFAPWLPLKPRRGAVTLAAPTPATSNLRAALAFGGFVTPAGNGLHTIGATFDHWDSPVMRDDDHDRNIGGLAAALPELANGIIATAGRAAVRCTSPDHLPLAGPLPDHAAFVEVFADLRHGHPWTRYAAATYTPGLYALTGLGSRGFVAAPLAAEVLAAEIAGEPAPLPRDLLSALHPARFLVRDLKRLKA